MLRIGIDWAKLPPEFGQGSVWTCWRQIRERRDNGAWEDIHRAALHELARHGQLDRSG